MKIVFFVHSIVSDWNNGHAHFLRGLMTSLIKRGHEVRSCEMYRNWSTDNVYQDSGSAPILEFVHKFPHIWVEMYHRNGHLIEAVERLTADADLVIVHEFNEPELVGTVDFVKRKSNRFVLLFHDTHHRVISAPQEIARFNLAHYDGVLAFGDSIARLYRTQFGFERVWVFHEAADTTVFYPRKADFQQDVVWIGNWGDEERSAEIRDFLIGPAAALQHLRFAAYGVRYPEEAVRQLYRAGIDYRHWIPNFKVPEVLAQSKMTLHIPRRQYRESLPGIPTIRPFEALACGTPLISTPWNDVEGLFRPGEDYLVASTVEEMLKAIERLSHDAEERERLAGNGLETIVKKHTCDHRAEQLLSIYDEICAK